MTLLRHDSRVVAIGGRLAQLRPPATIVWSDEFTGTGLSLATDSGGGSWRTRGHEGGWPLGTTPSVTQGYIDYAGSSWNVSPVQHPAYNPFSVANSILTITVRRNPGLTDVGGASWLGGYLVSNFLNGLTWRYGYFEWRMKLERPVRGMFPALWLYANIPGRTDAYNGAEIDVFEVFGRAAGVPWGGGWHKSSLAAGGTGDVGIDPTGGWHRYGVDWSAETIAFYVDGRRLHTTEPSVPAWFQQADLGIRMDYVMDPNWLPADDPAHSTASDPAAGIEPKMHVDYVRVYDRRPDDLAQGSDDPLAAS